MFEELGGRNAGLIERWREDLENLFLCNNCRITMRVLGGFFIFEELGGDMHL